MCTAQKKLKTWAKYFRAFLIESTNSSNSFLNDMSKAQHWAVLCKKHLWQIVGIKPTGLRVGALSIQSKALKFKLFCSGYHFYFGDYFR